MTTACRVVELDDASRALRRSIGPVAWAVLEDLAADAQESDAGWVVATNVRRIAADVGISKDTAARALRRLITAELVTRAPSGRGERGEFATVSYQLHVDRAVGVSIRTRARQIDATAAPRAQISLLDAGASSRRRLRDVGTAQASLFDEVTG